MHIHFFRFYLSFLLFYFFLFFSLFFFFFFLFLFFFFFFFFFFQAEDGIRDGNCDWSSDVCSSDLCCWLSGFPSARLWRRWGDTEQGKSSGRPTTSNGCNSAMPGWSSAGCSTR